MAVIERLLVLFAVLFLLLRIPLLLWPASVKQYLRLKILSGSDVSLRLFGVFGVILGGLSLWFLISKLSPAEIVVSYVSLVFLFFGAFMIVIPGFFRSSLRWAVHQSSGLLRVRGLIGVLFALILLYLAFWG